MRVTLSGFLSYYFLNMPWQKKLDFLRFFGKIAFTCCSFIGNGSRGTQTWFYHFLRMLAYLWKRSEIKRTSLSWEKWFFLFQGRFSDKIIENVKKNTTFFLGRFWEIWLIEKLRFNNRKSFYETDFHFWALKRSAVFLTGFFLAKNS